MGINLTINFDHPDAVAHRVRYARIDNVLTPSWITVSPDPINSPANIATDIPNGQYRIGYKPIYPDLRTCAEQFTETPPCPGLISINAYMSGNDLVVQYVAPSSVPKVRILVSYPNGGSFVANYVNNGNDIAIAIPNGLYGDYLVSGQSVCDEGSGFYSQLSTTVTVSRSPIAVNATLSFSFIKGDLVAFQTVLSHPISSAITINQIYANGFDDADCLSLVASAIKNTSMTINAGDVSTGLVAPSSFSGDWTAAIKYSMFNASVNGSPVVDGQILNIGGSVVVVSVPSCI